jgi:LysM repeat protein
VEVYTFEDLTFTIDNYIVEQGDNLDSVLKKRGLWPKTVGTGREGQLMRLVKELNPAIANLDQISTGQLLFLPSSKGVDEQRRAESQPLSTEVMTQDVVSYELQQPYQSPAKVVVRRQLPPGEEPPLPDGSYALRTDGRPSADSEREPSQTDAPYQESIARSQTSYAEPTAVQAPQSSNEGPLEMADDGTVYRTVTVRKGDTLERLLRREGMDPNLIYRHLIKLTARLNPNLKNTNVIIAGQELRLPAYGGYLAEFGAAGYEEYPLRAQASSSNQTRTDAGGIAESSPAKKSPKGSRAKSRQPAAPANPDRKFAISTKRLPPAPLPTADSQNAKTVLGVIFTRLGEEYVNKGRLFLPLDDPPHFDVDTATTPVVELKNGRRIILDLNRTLSPELIKRFRDKYAEYMIFQPTRGESMEKALERLWPLCAYYRVYNKSQSFEGGREVKLTLSADWLIWPSAEAWNKGQPLVINLAPAQDDGTPLPWLKFLNAHGITVIDLFKGQALAASGKSPLPVNNFTVIDVESDNPSAFAAALIKSFGFSPRIGVAVDLEKGRITTGGAPVGPGQTPPVFWDSGRDRTILEYGQLSTEDLNALRQNGFQVVSSAKDSTSVLKSILAALNIKLNGELILNGNSTGGPSITLAISGQSFVFNGRSYLYTSVALPENMTSLDPNQNVVVLKYREVPGPAPSPAESPSPSVQDLPDSLPSADTDNEVISQEDI